MDTPLQDCTAGEYRAVIHFLLAEGVKQAEIFRRMCVQYGENCMNSSSFYIW
jgi:hypothetical protein